MARFELAADKTSFHFKNEKSFIFHLVIFSGIFDCLVCTYTHFSSLIGMTWMLTALSNISIHIEHIPGEQNVISDLLSRFKFDKFSWDHLQTLYWIRCGSLLMLA